MFFRIKGNFSYKKNPVLLKNFELQRCCYNQIFFIIKVRFLLDGFTIQKLLLNPIFLGKKNQAIIPKQQKKWYMGNL